MPEPILTPRLFVHDRAGASPEGSGFLGGLVEQLTRLQREGAGAGPRRVPVLVPSVPLADRLRLELTRANGVCLGFQFLTPGEFFSRARGGTDAAAGRRESYTHWAPAALRWRLLPKVDGVARHLGFGAVGDPAGMPWRERFAAAELLARQLDGVLRQRPAWAAGWRRGRGHLPSAHATSEAWQRDLWCAVAAESGMPPHPAELLAELAAEQDPAAGALVYAAVDPVDPLTLETLRAFAASGWEVQVHVLLPSLGYLGDLPSRSGRRARWQEAAEETETATEAGHPLLVSLGQQAVGTFLFLERIDADYAAWPAQPEAVGPENESLLSRLQHDIRANRAPEPAARAALAPEDVSLRIHACHSPRRELEVLRDELLRAFADLGPGGLRPEDVVVGVTDFDTYAPLAEAILRRPGKDLPGGLPVRLTSVSGREANAVIVALLAILRVATGRQSASEVLGLLTLEAVQARLGLEKDPESLERLGRLVRDSGLTHGLDDGSGAPSPGGWRASLERLLTGFWMGPEPAVSGVEATGRWVHPLAPDLAADDTRLLALCDWLGDLRERLLSCGRPASAREWASRLTGLVKEALESRGFADEVRQCLGVIGELERVAADTPLDGGAVIDWLAPQLDNATSLRSSVDGSILFGRLEQVRGLPCRVLAILGLEHGRFPRAGNSPAWDLVNLQPERWDPDSRRRDRQLFLDAILTPADRLILAASNRNRVTGEDGPFSACVDDLLRAVTLSVVLPAEEQGRLEDRLVVRHSLQPFALGYFLPEAGSVRSFDAEGAATAAAIPRVAGAAPPPRPFAPTLGSPGAEGSWIAGPRLELGDLVAFWKDPARAWLKALRVEAPWEGKDERLLDDPPVELGGLGRHDVSAEQMQEALRNPAPDWSVVFSRLVAQRRMTPGVPGRLRWEFLRDEMRPMLDLLVADYRASTRRALEWELDLRDPRLGDLRKVTLAGTLRLLAPAAGEPPAVLVYRPGKYEDGKYQLEAWIQVLFAAAALADPRGAGGVLHGTGERERRRALAVVNPEDARRQLEALVGGYFLGQRQLIAYAPETSGSIPDAVEPSVALAKAASVWFREPGAGTFGPAGEGSQPAARLVWRDQDPFRGWAGEAWLHWADVVAKPLRAWWKPPEAARPARD